METKVNPLASALAQGLHEHAMKVQALAAAGERRLLVVAALHEAMRPYLGELLALPTFELRRDHATHGTIAGDYCDVQDVQHGGSRADAAKVRSAILHKDGITLCMGYEAKRHVQVHVPSPHQSGDTRLMVVTGTLYSHEQEATRYDPATGIAEAVADALARACKMVNYPELAKRKAACFAAAVRAA